MTDIPLLPADEAVRGALTRAIADLGHAPTNEQLAVMLHIDVAAVDDSLRRLAEAHALLLHPASTRPWVVHPFALSPGSCWVRTPAKGYWANCLYCALGIVAALECDATITTRLGGEDETVRYEIGAGRLRVSDTVFHLSTPPRLWWDNVVFACSTFQPFRTAADVQDWCIAHDLPRGAIMTMPQLWKFARDWYGSYVDQPWRKRSREEVAIVFERHGLTEPFWVLPR